MYEIKVIDSLGVNISGYQETNKPWRTASKYKYKVFMKEVFGQTRTIHASTPIEFGCTYHIKGCLFIVNGELTGSIQEQESDQMEKFTWFTVTR